MKYISIILILTWSQLLNAQTQGDALRQETKVDQVYSQYNLSGEGVVVVLIERGIDYQHPDFIDENGNTRIAYIYDMVDATGANDPDNPYGVGTIYSQSDIDQALDTGTPLATNDRYGHGTACMGLAAGDGSGMPGEPYKGVAYGATIIAVEVTNDAFPATGTIAGQAGFFLPSYIPIALQFVKDKTTELGLPSVTLLNLGSIGGPTDGTSDISQAMDDFTGPGRLLVCGVGDDGGGDNRAGDTLSQGETANIMIQKGAAGNLRFEAWYAGTDRLNVTIIRPNGTTAGPFTSPATNLNSDQQLLTDLNYYHRGSDQDFSQAANDKRQILIDLFGQTGTYTIRLEATSVSDGAFSASLNPANHFYDNGFLSHIVPGGSINDYASSRNTIVPTDYVFDNTYVDIDGIARARTGEGAIGDIWVGSSAGPTLDGRIGVDIAVPGEVCIGAYSADTYYSQFRFNIIENSNGLYGLQTAVSAAAPVLTGVLALMLEVNPNLSVMEAKDVLHESARTDAFTGTVPNEIWGHGKLDALAAIEATQNTLGLEELSFEALGFWFSPNPAKDQINYEWNSNNHESANLSIMDLQGRVLAEFSIRNSSGVVQLPNVSPGIYLLQVQTDSKIGHSRLVIY